MNTNSSGAIVVVFVGGKHKSWKKRWFILSDNCLYYFKSPKVSFPLSYLKCLLSAKLHYLLILLSLIVSFSTTNEAAQRTKRNHPA